jgi:DNA-binding response OmpR family regulator
MKRRILLVDDELAILLTLKAILEMNGFEVETAVSCAEACKKLKGGAYNMVITDMKMETDTSGYDVIEFAKQQKYDPATAILTAYPALGSDWHGQGAQSLLVKPVGTETLLRQIEALLVSHEDQKRAQGTAAKAATVNGKNHRVPARKAV